MRRGPRLLHGSALAVAAALAFLPLANWIPGGYEVPWYRDALTGWLSGGAIVLGGALVLTILSRTVPQLWRDGLLRPLLVRYQTRPVLMSGILAIGAGGLYTWIALYVFSGRPLLIDEIVQVFQARIFASGAFWLPAPPHPEFFSSLNVIDTGGRWYGQFPPGGPAMLALGTLAGAEWIVGPICGALAVLAFGALVARIEPDPAVGLSAVVLFCLAPFTAFMAGTHMNHTTTLMWLLVACAALAGVVRPGPPRPALALLSGLGLGAAAAIRPLDALAFAIPAGSWFVALALRDRTRVRDLLAAAVGVALPVAVLLWANQRTTGAPLRFGYSVMWGHTLALGFHAMPWGTVHTPARGLELINLYLLRLQTYLFEAPVPSLLPGFLALAFARRPAPFDRYLLVAGGLVLAGYFAYGFDGFYPGPRFLFPLTPVLCLWTARLPGFIRQRWGAGRLHRTTVYAGGLSALGAVTLLLPIRAAQYSNQMVSMRWDADRAAERAGVHDALILVREDWGAQLLARMWAAGISRPDAELIYRRVDRCALEQALVRLEGSDTRGRAAAAALLPLLADSARLVKSPFSADPTALTLPGAVYPPLCLARLREDQEGFTVFAPMLLAGAHGNVFARDLHARDSLLLAEYPGRPVYLLRPHGTSVGAEPRFDEVSLDSLRRAWDVETRRPGGN